MKVEIEFNAVGAEPEAFVGLWACLNVAAENGYRVDVQSTAEAGEWRITIDRSDKGTLTSLGELVFALAEGKHTLSLTVEGGNVIAALDAHVLEVADATYATGRAGIEGSVENALGAVNFKLNGELLDTFKRNENPLNNGGKWVVAFPEEGNIGKCVEAVGWVAAGAYSSAYWTEGAEEGGKPELSNAASGMVPRPLD